MGAHLAQALVERGVVYRLSRRKARRRVLQALFAADIARISGEAALEQVLEGKSLGPGDISFAQKLVRGVEENREKLDELLDKYAIGWPVERMSVVDRNILRLGLYELMFLQEEIPPSVAINEAVELAKIFSSEEASAFVNGILDTIRRDLEEGRVGM
ncbi:MAG: transcription antitermination factor NusB [Thermanaeromonas sp.]|uniref:transcription antitermination factor NusB n=1 Tax=Thermanaeromonas sp. TaxID=2003697 RepID=UPI00243D8E92|nr:transcription antitermination factor NusB [Thermanaeromonas sp.]MCG0277619.1 transcription antitermination factor NusB [Thermanaeromonas sp.]